MPSARSVRANDSAMVSLPRSRSSRIVSHSASQSSGGDAERLDELFIRGTNWEVRIVSYTSIEAGAYHAVTPA